MFKYETHLHSSEGSACAYSSAKELVRIYHECGYSGFALTNHFVTGNTSVSCSLDWKSQMNQFYECYLEAKEEGDKLDFDVFFAMEHGYGCGKEVLVYGVDLEFYIAHPELSKRNIDVLAQCVHEAGGIVVHAHPHRRRVYIQDSVQPRYDVCDGIEVFNACDEMMTNNLAWVDAMKLNKIMTSGGDIHKRQDERIGQAGMVFEERLRTEQEFLNALKGGKGKILIQGTTEIWDENFNHNSRKD